MAERYSRQRDAILQYLKSVTCHPTAEEIYSEVKKEIPNISLGTIYRNLSLLHEKGEIIVISLPHEADRFDINTKEHYHIICRKCGHVFDLFQKMCENEDKLAEKISGYKQVSHTLNFYGVCPDCTK